MQVVKRATCWNIKRKLFINLLQCLLHMCEWNLSWWKYAPWIWKGRQKGRLPSFWTSCHHEKGAHEIENSSYMKKKNTERKFVFQLKHFNVLEIHSKPFTKKLKPWLWQWHSQELLFRPTKWKAFGCSFRFVNDLLIYCLCYYGNGIFLLFHQLSDLKEIKTYSFLESFEL